MHLIQYPKKIRIYWSLLVSVSKTIWAAAWQNQQNTLCAKRISAWASTQCDQSLRSALYGESRTQCFFMRTAKTLIRLGGCPGWSESSLGAQVILLVLSVFSISTCSDETRILTQKKKRAPVWFLKPLTQTQWLVKICYLSVRNIKCGTKTWSKSLQEVYTNYIDLLGVVKEHDFNEQSSSIYFH